MREPVPALIKRLEWCEEDCRSMIDALARAGGRGIKLLERGLRDADPSGRAAIESSLGELKR